MEFKSRNHNQMASDVYTYLDVNGVRQSSRNGDVIRAPEPVTLTVDCPWERVNFSDIRDANPFFHLMEALAMLASFNNVDYLSAFAKNMANFSDDGKRYNAFYGERLRTTWGDQLQQVIDELQTNPTSRQCVAQLWDPADLGRDTKDKACNLLLMFDVRENRLCMTSVNRSNDAIWGICTGANVVHLSFFQEYVACSLGLEMGTWSHFSNNLHVYTWNSKWDALKGDTQPDLYTQVQDHVPLFVTPHLKKLFDRELYQFMAESSVATRNDWFIGLTNYVPIGFFSKVAVPLFNTWKAYKLGRHEEEILGNLKYCQAQDWCLAAKAWLLRRLQPSSGN